MARLKKDVRPLECILTNEEKLKYSFEMAEYLAKKTAAEARKKSFTAQIGSELAECEEHLSLLGNKIRTGREFRDVECSITYDWDRKVKTWTRNDTNEIVKEDIITEHELQEEAELNAKKESNAQAR
jgi:hypothetical protein